MLLVSMISFSNIKEEAQKNIENQGIKLDKNFEIKENLLKRKEIENNKFKNTKVEKVEEETENGVTFLLKEVEFLDKDKLLTQNEKYYVATKYRYKEVGIKEINDILNSANQILLKKGYITSRASVDTSNIKEDILIINILGGKVDKTILNDNSFNDKLKLFFNLPKNKVLNIKDIDTITDNFNRNSSNNFTLNVEPSEEEGYSNLIGTNEIKGKTILKIGYNNHGDEQGGQNRLQIGLDVDSLLGINDKFTFNIQGVKKIKPDRSWKVNESTLKPGQIAANGPVANYDPKIHGLLPAQRETTLWGFNYRVPMRSYLLSFSANKSVYRRSMYTQRTIYDLSGSSTTLNTNLSKILYRDNRSKLTGNVGVTRKNSKSYFEDIQLTDRNLSIGRIGLDYDFSLFKGVAGISTSYSKGLRIFHAERDENKVGKSPKAEGERVNGSFYWYKPIKNLTFRLSGEIQYSQDVNYPTEKMTIGGLGSVPGYQYDTISGDKGYSLISELSYTFKYGNEKLIPYIQYGVGETKNNKDNSEYRLGKVKGGSIGFRYSSKIIDVDVTYAKAFSQSKYLNPKDYEVYASVIFKYTF